MLMFYILAQVLCSSFEGGSKIYHKQQYKHAPVLIKKLQKRQLLENEVKEPLQDKESERKPIVLHFDTDGAFSGLDKYQCNRTGQIIYWGGASRYICKRNDLMLDDKKDALRKTLNNVADEIGKIINVKHIDFQLIDGDDYSVKQKDAEDIDHYMYVLIRPFDEDIVGASEIVNVDEKTGRPIQSEIYLNSRFIPNESQNITSFDRTWTS